MSSNGVQASQGTSAVADSKGNVVQVPDLSVPVNRIYNFVEQNRKAYFEDHSLDWCLDEIISRGVAEITRQVKTAKKTAENRAAGTMLKQFNLTPEQAMKLLSELAAKPKA